MKKLLASVLAASLLAMGTAAFAASYDVDVNGVNAGDVKGAQTVLITLEGKETASITADDIVYINQSDDANGFADSVKFLLKAGVTAGKYVIRTNDAPNGTITFMISDEEEKGQKVLDKYELDDKTKRAFTMPSVKIDEYKSILVTYKKAENQTLTLKYPFSKIPALKSLEGTFAFGLQIDDVPPEVTDMTVSLSKDEATKGTSTETPAENQPTQEENGGA